MLDESVKELALQIANSHKWEDADKLNDESWEIVSSPDGDTATYREALNKAEKAFSLEPNNWRILHTLGLAQYRVGMYEDAIEMLKHSEKLKIEPSFPGNIAYIAMSLYQLNRTEEAKAALKQLQELYTQFDVYDEW